MNQAYSKDKVILLLSRNEFLYLIFQEQLYISIKSKHSEMSTITTLITSLLEKQEADELQQILQALEKGEKINKKIIVFAGNGGNGKTTLLRSLFDCKEEGIKYVSYENIFLTNDSRIGFETIKTNKVTVTFQTGLKMPKPSVIKELCSNDFYGKNEFLTGPIFIETNNASGWKDLLNQHESLKTRVCLINFVKKF
jgi:hypothetical protein